MPQSATVREKEFVCTGEDDGRLLGDSGAEGSRSLVHLVASGERGLLPSV